MQHLSTHQEDFLIKAACLSAEGELVIGGWSRIKSLSLNDRKRISTLSIGSNWCSLLALNRPDASVFALIGPQLWRIKTADLFVQSKTSLPAPAVLQMELLPRCGALLVRSKDCVRRLGRPAMAVEACVAFGRKPTTAAVISSSESRCWVGDDGGAVFAVALDSFDCHLTVKAQGSVRALALSLEELFLYVGLPRAVKVFHLRRRAWTQTVEPGLSAPAFIAVDARRQFLLLCCAKGGLEMLSLVGGARVAAQLPAKSEPAKAVFLGARSLASVGLSGLVSFWEFSHFKPQGFDARDEQGAVLLEERQGGSSLAMSEARGGEGEMALHRSRCEELSALLVEKEKTYSALSTEILWLEEKVRASDQQKTLCILCEQGRRNVLFKPCNHFVICGECVPRRRRCPVCRGKILQTLIFDEKH